jgi:hypothetical protein
MKDVKDPFVLQELAQGLSAVAGRMEARDAALAASAILQAMKDTKHPPALMGLAQALAAAAARMESTDAATVTARAASLIMQVNDEVKDTRLALSLPTLLSPVSPAEIPSRSITVASAVAFATSTGRPLCTLTFVIAARESPPCRLTDQQLIELLKMPTCIGTARRVVLDQFGNRYRRYFADVWAFVRFAKENKLDLDVTTPPHRPEPIADSAKP